MIRFIPPIDNIKLSDDYATPKEFYDKINATGGSSTLYKLINTKSPKLYEWWTNHYITVDGILLKGLVYRRQTEALLFSTGNLKFFN